jgi:DNA-binding protein HU-beta
MGTLLKKHQIVAAMAQRAGSSRKAARAHLDAFEALIHETLACGDSLAMRDLGTFTVRARGPRTGRDPRTGGRLSIPASRVPAFKPARALKRRVAQN